MSQKWIYFFLLDEFNCSIIMNKPINFNNTGQKDFGMKTRVTARGPVTAFRIRKATGKGRSYYVHK